MSMKPFRLVETTDLQRCSTLNELSRYVGESTRAVLQSLHPIHVGSKTELAIFHEMGAKVRPISKIRTSMRDSEKHDGLDFVQ